MIFSAYWMVSSHSKILCELNSIQEPITDCSLHPQWSNKAGWKTTLNNLRLIIYAKRYPLGQPTILFWMMLPWLDIFPDRSLLFGFHRLHNA